MKMEYLTPQTIAMAVFKSSEQIPTINWHNLTIEKQVEVHSRHNGTAANVLPDVTRALRARLAI